MSQEEHGFPRAGGLLLRISLRLCPWEIPSEEPCQPLENPVLPFLPCTSPWLPCRWEVCGVPALPRQPLAWPSLTGTTYIWSAWLDEWGERKMWHETCDRWHMTHDRWGRWTLSQNFSSLSLMVWEWRCLEDIFTKDELPNESTSEEGVCRTAPGTPGLLIILEKGKLLFSSVNQV